ncbi:MAG: RsmD family RNA methyltransferase [Thermoleophilia bacterium]|nr:RsmD family RNA methyltransferase [Thermoleophilia bacterium]
MRVIAGRLGGRRLLAPRGWKVRPTSERVREAVFSALGPIEGAAVADLYCGTGALGIEAISRGAAGAVMVDRDTRPALGNVHNLGLSDVVELLRADPVNWLGSAGQAREFDLIFIDPPYRIAPDVAVALDRALSGALAGGGRVVTESAAGSPLELPSLEPIRERRYGRTLISFHRQRQTGE